MGPLSPHIAGRIALLGSRLLHGQENLWKTTRRFFEIFQCEFGDLGSVHEYHSSSSSSSWKRLWHEFEIWKELSLENNGTAFQRNSKADQWSDRNLWHKPDHFPRFKVGIDKLIAQSSLSKGHCQGLCLLWFCVMLGEKRKRPCWILEEAISMVSNWWKTHGVRVEDVPRTHHSGNPQSDSTDDGRITVWTRRQDHLHVNV